MAATAHDVLTPEGSRPMDILRFATAGSVDDGKSTLIGRLLYDSKAIFEDQLAAVERTSKRPRRGLHQPGAAHRRAARRAGAGHHDRRGLPLLRHATAQVHHRGHPGSHPVHPQHGHRRFHRRPGDRPRGRPQRADRAEHGGTRSSPPCSGYPHLVLARQQDGPGRLRPGRLRADQRGVRGVRGEAGDRRPDASSPSPRCTGTTWCSARRRCPGTTGPRCCTTWSTCTSPRTAT